MSDTEHEAESSEEDRLYHAIKSLPGWYYALENAQDSPYGAFGRAVGRIVSSILLAAGEEAKLVAVSGDLDDQQQSGRLVAIYPTLLVVVEATALAVDGSFVTRVWRFEDVSELTVETGHSFFSGVARTPRTRGFAFSFVLGGERIRLHASEFGHLALEVRDEAIYEGYRLVRDRSACPAR